MIVNPYFRKLDIKDCNHELLLNFDRYQEVNKCYRKENDKWIIKDVHFIDNWDNNRKKEIIQNLIDCIKAGGTVYGAYIDDKLIGFSSVINKLFGKNKEYVSLDYLHVSYDYRNKGIGKELFKLSCLEAIRMSANKLYISAQSSVESQGFYRSLGCIETVELNQKLYEKEPYDCHMEYVLKKLK